MGKRWQKICLTQSRSWLLNLQGVRITRAHELIKSPSEMNKVGRAVKGSALYLYSNLIIKGSRSGTGTAEP